MSYISLGFAAFVLILMLAYYLLPKRARGDVLLAGSLIFYTSFGLQYLPFLLFTATTTYFAAKLLRTTDKKKQIFIGCIAVNVLVWFVIKELPWVCFMAGRLLQQFKTDLTVSMFSLIVPIGISYYILQSIGYLADVYCGKIEPEENYRKYLLFLSWFPAIVQGPISKYDQLSVQLSNQKPYDFESMRDHLVLILFGLVKKMVIADRIGIFVGACFVNFRSLQGVILYAAAVAYAIQLYTDFSGCVDICRGVSGLFGVELVHNFDRPYLSRSIKEFWGKWHMSLSSWLKDYVYIPLGGNRKGVARKYMNLLITFLVSGLWHGAGFNFFVWGGLHALYQIVGQSTQQLRDRMKLKLGIRKNSFVNKAWQILVTFHLVTFAWIIFRAGGLMSGLEYMGNMFASLSLGTLLDGTLYDLGMTKRWIAFVLMHVLILFLAELQFRHQEDAMQCIARRSLIVRWSVCFVLIFDILFFGVYGAGYNMASFMYGGF